MEIASGPLIRTIILAAGPTALLMAAMVSGIVVSGWWSPGDQRMNR